MEKVGGSLSDDVDAEQFLGRGIEDEFQAPGGVAANLAPRNFAKKSHPDFVGNTLVCQLLLCFSNEGNFRNRINPVGIIGAIGIRRYAESPGCGDASLLHGNRAEAATANHIADGDDVLLAGL